MAQRTLAVVVNGVKSTVTANENAPLRTIIAEAIKNTDQEHGHPPSDWEVKLFGQPPLDLSRKIGEYAFPDDVVLYIDLIAGGGG